MTIEISTFPIFPFLDQITQTLNSQGLLLLSAEPGAGKTTIVPWKLLSHPDFNSGKLLLLEPRRLAARAAANRIASLLGEKVGQTVGIRTRLETVVSNQTRLEVITEGVFTRLIQTDPQLRDVNTVLFDEFHTRTLPGDLGLALAWETRKRFRPDLKIAVLSATLPSQEITQVFSAFPLLEVPGHVHPVKVFYHPPISSQEKPWEAAARLCKQACLLLEQKKPFTILCFLPGYFEMNRALTILKDQTSTLNCQVYLLHGQMPPDEQRVLLDPDHATKNRIIISTNVAETSLTIPGVKAVVDIGLERRVRFSPRTGMDHWETQPISLASARQRQGRAGRTAPGICLRWWQETDFHEPFALPEIAEADLAGLVLECCAWGASSPLDLTWLTPPPQATLTQATTLLQTLNLLDDDLKITALGRECNRFALHPRLARMVLHAQSSGSENTAALIAALLENEDLLARQDPDFRERVYLFKQWSQGKSEHHQTALFKRIWEECRRILRTLRKPADSPQALNLQSHAIGNLLLSAYPDRLAKRTRLDDPITSRWLLATGRGGILKGPLSQEAYLAIADLDGGQQNAKIFSAAPITQKELMQSQAVVLQEVWRIEWSKWKPKGKSEVKIGAIVIKEQKGGLPEKSILQREALKKLNSKGLSQLPWNSTSQTLLARFRFIARWGNQPDWPSCSDEHLIETALTWLIPAGTWTGKEIWDEQSLLTGLKRYLTSEQHSTLNTLAPEIIRLAAGFKKKVNYQTDDFPKLSARLQEFFGCQTTPTISNQPLVLDILNPANRTVQLTRDLAGFWENTYPEVRKQFEAKYPKHHWPDNPKNKKYIKQQRP
jgi:ATP-dependent RNA helicase HrpB